MNKNMVLGLFQYADDNNETDIEVSNWWESDPNNLDKLWYTVQPGIKNVSNHHFTGADTGSNIVFSYIRTPEYVSYNSYYQDSGVSLGSWVFYNETHVPHINMNTRINLWTLGDNNGPVGPSDNQNVEIVIDSFLYTPGIPSKSTPTITWSNPVTITHGTALSNTQLNANSGVVAGSFVYTPAIGTVLGIGTHTLHADFTPAEPWNYALTSKDVTIVVQKAIPVITWVTRSVRPGTVLNSTQLCALTNIPGTFYYAQPAGTAFDNYGSTTLSVTFIPTDMNNYSVVTKTCVLHVTAMDIPQHMEDTANASKVVSDTAKPKHGYYLDPKPIDIGSKNPVHLGDRAPMKL